MAVARNVAVAIDSVVAVERRIAVVREGGGTLVALGGQLVRSGHVACEIRALVGVGFGFFLDRLRSLQGVPFGFEVDLILGLDVDHLLVHLHKASVFVVQLDVAVLGIHEDVIVIIVLEDKEPLFGIELQRVGKWFTIALCGADGDVFVVRGDREHVDVVFSQGFVFFTLIAEDPGHCFQSAQNVAGFEFHPVDDIRVSVLHQDDELTPTHIGCGDAVGLSQWEPFGLH